MRTQPSPFVSDEPSSGKYNSLSESEREGLKVPLRTDPIAVGELIGGKYVVECIIGMGGVGIVLRARHRELDELVAVKLLLPEVQHRDDIVRRFAREAKAAVRIKSEYAARVFDVGVAPGRGPYLVMEHLAGRDLGTVLVESGPVPVKRAVEYVMQAAEALAVAHACGIVHRDVKPENLFLARRADGSEIVKVLDFGISKAALTGSVFGGDAQPLKTQDLMGTPLYMSPKQIRCTATVDHRTDIWSLGVVLYELITGVMPFHGDAVTEICARVLEASPPPLASHLRDVPDGLQAVLDRCFQKDPAKRFQNVAELAISLLPFAPALARVLAERTSTIMRAAGHEVPVSMRFNSSGPPPPSLGSVSTLPIPSAPAVPSFSHAPERPSQLSMTNPEALDAIARDARSTRRVVLGASIVVLALAGGAAAYVLKMSRAVPAAAAAPAAAPAIATRAVALESDPAGARVALEGRLLGETPLTVQLPVGSHAVEVAKAGFSPETLSVTVAGGETEVRRFRITLKPLKAVEAASTARAAGLPPATPARTGLTAGRPWAPAATTVADAAKRSVDPPAVSGTAAPAVAKSARPNSNGDKPRPNVQVIGDDQINVKIIE